MPLLTAYFYQEKYRDHINVASDTKGKMARAYCDLIRRMWREGGSGAERPSEVKSLVGKVASRFMGYDQQVRAVVVVVVVEVTWVGQGIHIRNADLGRGREGHVKFRV